MDTILMMFQSSAATFFNPMILLIVAAGTFLGLVFGALPGLSATMGVALLIPLTFTMDTTSAFGMMLGTYIGGMAGGAVSATLLNIPGTPSAVVTCLDGYPMAKQGRGAEALGWAAFASGFGSIVSWFLLVTLSPVLAGLCTSFGPPEYAALAFFGLTIIAAVSGKSLIKGLIAGIVGVILSFVGTDPIWGDLRFTFGNINLMTGVSTIPAMIGLYSIPQIIISCTGKGNPHVDARELKLKNFLPSFKKIWEQKWNIIRSSIIGTGIGIIPATGGNIASFIAYDQTKRFSKHPDEFGNGAYEGVIASEAANNGVCGGALIPMMTLGIPGDSVTAALMGGLIIHGLRPGPALFADSPQVVSEIFATVLMATILMVLIQCVGIKLFVRILNVPVHYLNAALVILSLVGSFALRSNFFDVILTLMIGLFGYLMIRGGFPTAPIVLGLVLGSMFEGEFRRALKLSHGSMTIFFKRPVSCVFILIGLAVIGNACLKAWKKKPET
ncbi:tripartite tricarboxylate transporter permease [Enterocloster lavalensis]|uniref:tripartite tricarboxylate transporter permease n=1 Tax=Enterocloster lavalensis TaxID=460384 RepID=UPI0026658DF8|nr:tripartite tricarboxylate transporter permease [Enterocloster lavalensis]